MLRLALSTLTFVTASFTAQAGERASQLVNSFQVMCTIEPIDFAQIDAKAAAMRLPVRSDKRTPPDPSGNFVHSKAWLLPLKSGPHEFTASEAHGPKGDVRGCGIGAPDVDGNDFRSELTKAANLSKPSSETKSEDGQRRITTWPYAGAKLMLTDGTPRSQPGIYLLLIETSKAK